ncbi:hypothetical protein HBB16_20465 [Pseudonocardia sp. MCCB 268]|nr:hypothetical protein [Pseudonocardia cytotoxica]
MRRLGTSPLDVFATAAHAEIGDDAPAWPVLGQHLPARSVARRGRRLRPRPGPRRCHVRAGQRDHHCALRRSRPDVRDPGVKSRSACSSSCCTSSRFSVRTRAIR